MLTTRIPDFERTQFRILKKNHTIDHQFQHAALCISYLFPSAVGDFLCFIDTTLPFSKISVYGFVDIIESF